MNARSKNRDQSVSRRRRYPGAHFDERFVAVCSGVHQVFIGDDSPVFSQKNYGRPAKSKIALLMAFFRRSVLGRLNNAADGQRADLDLQHATAIGAGKCADRALVSKTRRAGVQRNGMYGVQSTSDTNSAGRGTVDREVKAVVIAGCQADNENSARFEPVQSTGQVVNVDSAAFDLETVSRHLGECEHPALGGCDHVLRVSIDRSCFGFEFPCEKCIQRSVGGRGKFGFGVIDFVAANEGRYLTPAPWRSFQPTGDIAEPWSLEERIQKCGSQPRFVEKVQRSLAVDPFHTQIPGLPVDKTDLIDRRSHMLIAHASEISDQTAEYTIVSVDPSSPGFHDFAALPHDRSLNSLAPTAADVKLQLGADSLFYRHGEARLFGCYRNGKLVGRVVASVDHDLPDQEVGHFGYFEACSDEACAEKLMQAAEKWLREKGKSRIEGPINLNMLAGYRFQTKGFDTQAFPGEPRNPDYYPALIMKCMIPALKKYPILNSMLDEKTQDIVIKDYFNIGLRI